MKNILLVAIIASLSIQVCSGADGEPAESHFSLGESVKLFQIPKMPGKGATWLSLVDMRGVKSFPFDHALFFSTDHHNAGGIWMYLCKGKPSEAQGWKSYDQALADGDFDYLATKPAGNPIYIDKKQGRSTETPHALVIDGVVYLTYHNNGAGRSQSTLLATSTDGVNFSRINGNEDSVVLDYAEGPGDGHTGYFRWGINPFGGIDYKYIGYSLHGGGNSYHMAMWVSNDAKEWRRQHVMKSLEGIAEEGMIINWHGINPGSIREIAPDLYVAVCAVSTRASGTAERTTKRYEIFLGPDGVSLKRKPRLIPALETSVVIDDVWHWISLTPDRKWAVGAKGNFTGNAVKTLEIESKSQSSHIWRK